DGDAQVQVVVERVAGGAARRVRPGQGDAEGLGRVAREDVEGAGLAGGGEQVRRILVAHEVRRAVEGEAEVQVTHALVVRVQVVVGPGPRHVAGGVDQPGLHQRRAGGEGHVVDDPLPRQ